jgi:hypothetical protein
MSVAQYIRDAARARLDGLRDPSPPAPNVHARAVRSVAHERVEESTALWEQGRQARRRAADIRAESAEQRERRAAHRALAAGGS